MATKPQSVDGGLRETGGTAKDGQSARASHRRRMDLRRKARAAVPERLDRMLLVTPARGWIALLALLVAAAAVGIWSVLGEVATYVEARGFLLNRGGKVVEAIATGHGRLSEITVAVGDEIEKDSTVALIVNDELAARHASALALVEERGRALEALKAAITEESGMVGANNTRRRQQLDELETTTRDLLEVARANLENSKQLFEEKVITRRRLQSAEREFNEVRRALLDLNRDRGSLEADEITYRNNNAARIREMTAQVEAARRQASEFEAIATAERVLAPVSGQVTEVKATIGAVLSPGRPVASIRTGTADLELLLYVPPAEGKRVEAGMEALVSPSTVRREEFGSIRGTVEYLSPFPVSLAGIVAVLQNQGLAQSFSKDGPPYAGRIALLSDPTTVSGFAWTSPKAASQRLTAGTLASVEIKTDSQPPITLAIPLLKELLGLR